MQKASIYQDQAFAHLFPHNGRPVEAPWRLALITIMQFMEDLASSPGRRCGTRTHRLEICGFDWNELMRGLMRRCCVNFANDWYKGTLNNSS
jgi:hypothetical protein